MIVDTKLRPNQRKYESLVQGLFPAWAPVKLSIRASGQSIEADHMVLGYRAGPSIDVGHVLHEIGHLVEIDDARACVWGWGLTYTQVEVLGRMYDQPVTYQGALRECRAIAWQKRLAEAIGFNLSINEYVKPLRFLPDFTMVPHREDGTIKDWDNDRFRFLRRHVLNYLKTYTVEAAKTELYRKCEVLQGAFRAGGA